jgi:hypothetical protein
VDQEGVVHGERHRSAHEHVRDDIRAREDLLHGVGLLGIERRQVVDHALDEVLRVRHDDVPRAQRAARAVGASPADEHPVAFEAHALDERAGAEAPGRRDVVVREALVEPRGERRVAAREDKAAILLGREEVPARRRRELPPADPERRVAVRLHRGAEGRRQRAAMRRDVAFERRAVERLDPLRVAGGQRDLRVALEREVLHAPPIAARPRAPPPRCSRRRTDRCRSHAAIRT